MADMRVTGGEFCGRRIKVPPGARVRPTQDRVREALFSMLATVVPGADFIDLFAGSGAVGLEALSRGAASVTWVEQSARNVELLRANLALLRAGTSESAHCQVVCADVLRWLRHGGGQRTADVVFADPPYMVGNTQGFGGIMELLCEKQILRTDGFFVAEMPRIHDPKVMGGWELLRDRTYGHTRLALYRLRQKEVIYGEDSTIPGDI